MARYDVFRRPGSDVYLLDVQNDLIDHLKTRVVAPLVPLSSSPPPVRKLNPVFEIDGQKYVMATHLLATIPMLELGERRQTLAKHHDEIVTALDMLFQGF